MASLFSLALSDKIALTTEAKSDHNILQLDSQSCDSCGSNARLAATSSNFSIRLHSRMTLGPVDVIRGHTKKVTGIKFSHGNPNVLYSASRDKTVKSWDFRTSTTDPVQVFSGHEDTNTKLCCLSISCDDRVLCAGTETDKENDSFLVFWDSRRSDALGVYSESHEDDITQVKFHPERRDILASGSTDGLVCMFDISQPCEDDAIYGTLNSESSVADLGWSGGQFQHIYCTTHINTLHLWDSDEFDVVGNYIDMREKLTDSLSGDIEIDYIVDCFYDSVSDKLHVAAGSHGGALYLFRLDGDVITHVSTLDRGHTDDVRCLTWDQKMQSLVTGGDDSMLCLWKEGSTPKSDVSRKAKVPSALKKKRKFMPT